MAPSVVASQLRQLRKSIEISHQPKGEDTNQEKLYLFHMDLCGPMRVESIKGKKYILVIVKSDYSRFTWVRFLRSKDEAPDAIIKCIKNIQVRLNATVRNVRTNNGTEFFNQTLRDFYENVGISHQTFIRSPLLKKSCCKVIPKLWWMLQHNVDIFKSSSVSMGQNNQHSLLYPKPFLDPYPLQQNSL
ncbi:retrovirus-related pol polyprotein from transposon TNT 1-94 [Tanacetum coccineum]|uniref:Retrovirus-related pol polyprotein from transposon TNT 1-94 n=1 Tax=Tanacetum coccineum TaxID=301880 RepID=A0ABQ5CX61_9ASTR